MAAVLLSPRTRRIVIGALGGKPLLLRDGAATIEEAARALPVADDAVSRQMRLVTLRRALAEAGA
jgi:hypothetical protein